MTLDEVKQEAKSANAARLRLLVAALCSHIESLHTSFKVVSLEAKIGLREQIPVEPAEGHPWPGDW